MQRPAAASGGLSPAGKGKGKGKGRRVGGYSPGEGAWRGVPRDPGCLVEHFVPFTATAIGSIGLAAPSHEAWLLFEAEALEDNVTVRRSH